MPRTCSRSSSGSGTVRLDHDHAVAPVGHLLDHRGRGGPAVRGEDQHRAAEVGGHRLVAQDHLGVVGTGEVREDDRVGGVPALGQRAAEPAGRELQLSHGGRDPLPGGRGDVLVLVHDPGDRGDGDTGGPRRPGSSVGTRSPPLGV